MNRLLLRFAGVSEIVSSASMGLVTLTDEYQSRAISIICDPISKSLIALRHSHHTTLCAKMLPEVLSRVIGDIVQWSDFEIYIYNLVDGEYKTVLRNRAAMMEYPMRVSDSVLLSLIADVPIYIDSALFFEQSTPYDGGTHRLAVPINAISTPRLEEALRHAIDSEDYRLASQIQEELRKRKS